MATVEVLTSGKGNWKAELNAAETGIARSSPMRHGRQQFRRIWKERPWPTGPVETLRRAFRARSGVRSARLYATALGAYRFWINGRADRIQILAPGWTDYREHVAYQVYDVTGAGTQGAMHYLAPSVVPGWYTTPLQWTQEPYNYGDTPPALRAQLRVEYNDGSVEWVNATRTGKQNVADYEGKMWHSEL